MESFAHTTAVLTHKDGTEVELKAGHLIRPFGAESDGFSTMIILGFSDEGNAKVARPYAYASCVGTTGPTVLVGSETLTVSLKRLGEMKVLPLNKHPMVSR
jgi:hypothetical protein